MQEGLASYVETRVGEMRQEAERHITSLTDTQLAIVSVWLDVEALSVARDAANTDDPVTGAKLRGAVGVLTERSFYLRSVIVKRRAEAQRQSEEAEDDGRRYDPEPE